MSHQVVCLFAVVVLAGCSAGSYKPAVDTFATATAQASDAYTALEDTVRTAETERLTRLALDQRRPVGPPAGDCKDDSKECSLVWSEGGQNKPLAPSFGYTAELMKAIAAYAANLQAIVASTTADDVKTSVAAADGSAKSLGDTLKTAKGAQAVGTDLSDFAVPAGNVFAWFAGEYINKLQVSALRHAVDGADGLIEDSAAVLNDAVAVARPAALTKPREDYLGTHDTYGDALRSRAPRAQMQTAQNAFITAAAAYDAALKATAPSVKATAPGVKATERNVFDSMADAHHNLKKRLDGEDVSFADVFASVQEFAAKAQGLATALTALQKAVTDAKPKSAAK